MAEAIFRSFFADSDTKPQIASAGIQAFAGDEASENAILAMQERGVELRRHRSRLLSPYLLDEADIIITMTEVHKKFLLLKNAALADKIFSMAEIGGKVISDPYGGDLRTYLQCAEEIDAALQKLYQQLQEKKDQGNEA
ncbi:Protein-arginine-phosphatase [bioreactor metagenome]|uniref:Protein-arginine-phosphatase n=1 Tax=bioreactor metagenome TaxID=1076179 RepID=A0A645JXX7_9ZZZZ